MHDWRCEPMPASKKLARSDTKSFSARPFNIPFSRVSRTLGALVVVVAILCGGAFLLLESITDRQIAGTERVLMSLDAEARELKKYWGQGSIPARMLQAELDHIDDEKSQQQAQLALLKKSSNHG